MEAYPKMDSLEEMTFPIPPITGDVIFCTGNSLIKSAQALPVFSNREITHVAIMASSSEVAEAMIKRTVSVSSFGDWFAERRSNGKKEEHFILRSEAAIKRGLDIQRRIAFYLEEPYWIRNLLDWTKPGTSICTSFVGKVLSTANVVTEPRGKNVFLPGRLFEHLKRQDFQIIPKNAFILGAKRQADHSFFESTTKLMDILDELEPALADTQRQMVGWTSVVEVDMKKDPFTALGVWLDIADKALVPFGEELAQTCKTLMECIALLEARGPRNWQVDFPAHEARIELLRRLAAEHYELVSLFSKYLSNEYLQKSVGNQPIKANKKIYANVAMHLGGANMAANTIRAILGVT
jgi:hypothetical protein